LFPRSIGFPALFPSFPIQSWSRLLLFFFSWCLFILVHFSFLFLSADASTFGRFFVSALTAIGLDLVLAVYASWGQSPFFPFCFFFPARLRLEATLALSPLFFAGIFLFLKSFALFTDFGFSCSSLLIPALLESSDGSLYIFCLSHKPHFFLVPPASHIFLLSNFLDGPVGQLT